jgi:hypothetical protein
MANGDAGKNVSPHFKLILLAVLGLTAATLTVNLVLSIRYGHPDAGIQSLITGTETVWKGGCGAIFGLIGGRAA